MLHEDLTFNVWDVGGNVGPVEASYAVAEARVVALVFDLTRPETFEALVRRWAPESFKVCREKAVYLLVGNDFEERKGRGADECLTSVTGGRA